MIWNTGTVQWKVQAFQVKKPETFAPKFYPAMKHDLIDQCLSTVSRDHITGIPVDDEIMQCSTRRTIISSLACSCFSFDQVHFCHTHIRNITNTQVRTGGQE